MFPSTPLDFLTIIFVGAFLALLGYDFTGGDTKSTEHEVPTAAYLFVGILAVGCLVSEPIWPLSTGAYGTFFQMVGMAAIAAPAAGGGGTTPPPTTAPSLQVMGVVQDLFTHTALGGTNAKVDILTPGVYSSAIESITVSTSTKTFTSVLPYAAGTPLVLHISSTEGNGYYDAFYPVTVPSNVYIGANAQQFYWLSPTGASAGSPFYLENRVASTGLSMTLTNSTGYAVSSATGATATTNTYPVPSQAGASGFFSAQSTSVVMTINLYLGDLNVGYGVPMSVITPSLEYQTRQLVMWLAVNNTAVNAATIQGSGWQLVPNYAVGYYVFYMPLNPVQSSPTTYGSFSIQTTFDTSAVASNKNITIGVWLADLQNPDDAHAGVYDPAPAAKGASSQVGLTALLPATGYIRLASGAPTGPWLSCKFKTK